MKGLRIMLLIAAVATLAVPFAFAGPGPGGNIITRGSQGSVNTTQLADGAVTTAKLAAGSVNATKLDPSLYSDPTITITGNALKVADGTINTTQLSDGAVTTAKLAAGAVTTAKLGAFAVTGGKIAQSFSAQQTGTGAGQNVAHNLGVIPTVCQVLPEDTTAAGIVAAGYACTYGSASSTNCVVTCTSGLKFKMLAIAP